MKFHQLPGIFMAKYVTKKFEKKSNLKHLLALINDPAKTSK
jgi:hypothetical protein